MAWPSCRLQLNVGRHFSVRKLVEPVIYNISTVPGKSGVAIIRVSGEGATKVISAMTRLSLVVMKPRYLYYTRLFDQDSKRILDQCMLAYFAGPKSFTGEDMVEIHCHGSLAVTQSIFRSLSKLENFKLSEPGEFTKRAFYRAKMDLTEMEALADLIDAETDMQQSLALSQLQGSLKNTYESWRTSCLLSLANLEAYIDFAEDDQIDPNVILSTRTSLIQLKGCIEEHLNDGRKGQILRAGIRTVIIGPPNVGKSTLMNYLSKKRTSIVSPMAGTTRDIIESTLDICGFPVILADTAGIRRIATDQIENEGIQLSFSKLDEANVRIIVLDSSNFYSSDSIMIFDKISRLHGLNIFILNKVDLVSAYSPEVLRRNFTHFLAQKYPDIQIESVVITSLLNNSAENILECLRDVFTEKFNVADCRRDTFRPLVTRERHRQHLLACVNALSQCVLYLDPDQNGEIIISTEYCRQAMTFLGKITGAVDVEDVLDVLFKNFCIGK